MTDPKALKVACELKTCPFCGGKAYIHESGPGLSTHRTFYPRCRTKECIGNQGWVGFDTKAEAIAAWNKRSSALITELENERKAAKKAKMMYLEALIRPLASSDIVDDMLEKYDSNIEQIRGEG